MVCQILRPVLTLRKIRHFLMIFEHHIVDLSFASYGSYHCNIYEGLNTFIAINSLHSHEPAKYDANSLMELSK